MHGLMAHSWRVLRVSPREFEHYVYIVCIHICCNHCYWYIQERPHHIHVVSE